MRPRTIVTAALAAIMPIAGTAHTASAWNAYGHQLAAYLTFQELAPAERKHFADLLKLHPQCDLLAEECPPGFDLDCYLFMRAATWPDIIRDTKNPLHTEHRGPWHYINIPIIAGDARAPSIDADWKPGDEPENVVQAIPRALSELGSPALSAERRAIALCWALHLIEDLHQPLHAGTLFSDELPDGDQGGNLLWIQPGERPIRLHGYWDDALGTGRRDLDKLVAHAGRVAAAHPRAARSHELSAASAPADWAVESFALARREAYRDGTLAAAVGSPVSGPPPEAPPLPPDYAERALAVSERRIALSAWRTTDRLRQLIRTSASE